MCLLAGMVADEEGGELLSIFDDKRATRRR